MVMFFSLAFTFRKNFTKKLADPQETESNRIRESVTVWNLNVFQIQDKIGSNIIQLLLNDWNHTYALFMPIRLILHPLIPRNSNSKLLMLVSHET